MAPLSSSRPRVILLIGPTGVGKTQLALAMVSRFGGQIVSADSQQVYRGMDIGTAKPSPQEQRCAPHHLIDVVNPDEPFDVSRYCELARRVIERLHREKINIFIVGGTGLYVRALLGGLIAGPGADEALRGRLKEEARQLGRRHLHETLRKRDAAAAARINPNDSVRVIRALEVWELTGRSIVDYQRDHRFREQPYEVLRLGLKLEREQLRERIDARAEGMIAAGLVEEVQGLLARGYDRSLKSMQALGYRHICRYLAGSGGLAEAVRTIKHDTLRYAKRQLTWFKTEREILWLPPDDIAGAARRIGLFLGE